MSATSNTKPPRPCTEYNIFFQLERSHILQVRLGTPPGLEVSEVFHPSQSTYAGLPPLPARYADLVLPYDWHLPGKEQRRKRKHRKSHGAIGFHELSSKIVEAWKNVDDDIKSYCSSVCAAGMAKYKAEMKTWKKNGGKPGGKSQKKKKGPSKEATKGAIPALLKQEPEQVKSAATVDLPATTRSEVHFPASALSDAITMEDVDRAFDNDFPLIGAWDAPIFAFDGVSSTDAPHGPKKNRNSSVVSNDSADDMDGAVDMDDSEIFDLWNGAEASADPLVVICDECAPAAVSSGFVVESSLQHTSTFGFGGYGRTMRDVRQMKDLMDVEEKIQTLQRLKAFPAGRDEWTPAERQVLRMRELMAVEERIARLQRMKGLQPRRRSIVASSA